MCGYWSSFPTSVFSKLLFFYQSWAFQLPDCLLMICFLMVTFSLLKCFRNKSVSSSKKTWNSLHKITIIKENTFLDIHPVLSIYLDLLQRVGMSQLIFFWNLSNNEKEIDLIVLFKKAHIYPFFFSNQQIAEYNLFW